ncbi:MAG: hypothetical protein FWD87_07420 [Spirochaetaceae bacterium]|nr:hypothetical protein [Spirochaetaceae bacterium]
MIVKMKKVSLVILDSTREESLEKLRKLGVVHIAREYRATEATNALIEKKTFFEKTIFALPKLKKETKSTSGKPDLAEAEKVVAEANSIMDKINGLQDGKEKDKKEILNLEPWGDFNPSTVSSLEQSGFSLGFYVLTKEQFKNLPKDVKYVKVNKIKDTVYILAIFLKGEAPVEIAGEKLFLPAAGLKQLSENIKKKDEEIVNLKKELEKFAEKKNVIEEGLKELNVAIEFESVNAEMNTEDRFSYISGYLPVNLVDELKAEASVNNWALLIRDPSSEDNPPTLIKNNRFVEFLKPLLTFLDVTPGYKEFDISFFFLLFFIPFVGMIVGDAGYGAVFLTATILLRFTVPKFRGRIFGLFFVLSCSIIAWGTMTGNWFGSETISKLPLIAALTIPQIAAFSEVDTSETVRQLALGIGMVQLTVGILINFARKMPSLVAFANFGWLFVLYGMYFVVQFFVIGGDSINPLALKLISIGFFLLIIFSYQEKGKNFFKGTLVGLAWSPLTALNCIDILANIISYIRLFAVGLAGWAVASNFNAIAAGVANTGGTAAIIGAAAIVVVSQTFNIALCTLAVVVHGVRLNMLEFGSKVGMEWTGYPYSPFKKEGV